MSVGFNLLLTNISTQYFSEALFLNKIPPCSAKTQSGEHPNVTVYLLIFKVWDVAKIYNTCMNQFLSWFSHFQLPVKPDSQMTLIEALKKWVDTIIISASFQIRAVILPDHFVFYCVVVFSVMTRDDNM